MYKRMGCWYSDFWHEGVRHTKSHGKVSKTRAKEGDATFRTDVKRENQDKVKRILFETFAKEYLKRVAVDQRPKTVKRKETSINMMNPYFGKKILSLVNPFMVEQYKKKRKDAGVKPATINRDLNTLSNIFKKAISWKNAKVNPVKEVNLFKEDNEQRWVLDSEEEGHLLEACEKSPQRKGGKYLKDLVLFALNSGMRLNEIFSLRKEDIRKTERNIDVRHTKTGKNRNVPINGTLMKVIDRRMDKGGEFLFSNSRGRRLTVLTNAFWYAVKIVKLEKTIYDGNGKAQKIRFRFHDCRHTFGSRLGMNGADLKTIMEIMGHVTAKVALGYLHPTPQHKLEAVKKLDEVPSKVPSVLESERKVANLIR